MNRADLLHKVYTKDPALGRDLLRLEHAKYKVVVELLLQEEEDEEAASQEAKNWKSTRKRPQNRSVWVRLYLKRRETKGHYDNLIQELAEEDPLLYKNFMRLDEGLFDEIVVRVTPLIEKKTTWWREPLSVGLRVAITLRFLATGSSYRTLGYSFRVPHNTISLIIPETCRAIVTAFGDEVLKMPRTPEEWKKVSQLFEEKWNFPHAVGAIDGKHVRIKSPIRSGSMYFNYKKFFSIILLALVDADYKFMYIDVGAVGSESDAGVFTQSRLAKLINNMQTQLPTAEPLPGNPEGPPVEYFLIGDDAFALKTWMMKPYPNRGLTTKERVYNYRLSRARRVVENAFGILANR